jgi:hypothetical protein
MQRTEHLRGGRAGLAARHRHRAGAGATGQRFEVKVVIQVSDGDAAKWNLALNNA